MRILLLFVIIFAGLSRADAAVPRPSYQIDVEIDYQLLTLKGSAEVSIPNNSNENLRDAVFFIYANSSGIVGDERRKQIVVDGIWLGQEAVNFSLDGPILRANLNKPQSRAFVLRIDYHGVIPRSADGGTGSLFGGLGGLLENIQGGASSGNNDFGLYSYSGGVLSLGSFWYPQLAVRKNGKWIDEAPKGLGDVAYAEAGDYDVRLRIPAHVKAATSGVAVEPGRYVASNVRDFAILLSEDYVCKSKSVNVSGKSVNVESCATQKNAARLDSALDAAGHSLQIFSKRFGAYPYNEFRVVEGTLRGGAGGMEFSGMTAIAPMLYTDWKAQLGALSGLLKNLGSLDKVLGVLNPGSKADAAQGSSSSVSSQATAGPLAALDSLMEMTIAHEVAHQWWAIAVGSDSVREPFVDESLTNYSAMLYFEDRYGKEAAENMIRTHLKLPYSMARLMGLADAPANLPTAAYGSNMRYSAIVYGKGALYYDAVRRAAGDSAFFSALRDYYARYRGGLAGPRSFLEILHAKAPAAGADALYRHWIEEMNGDQDISGPGFGGMQGLLGDLLKN